MTTRTETTTTPGSNGPRQGIKESVRSFVDQGQEKVGAIRSRVVDVKDKALTSSRAYLDRTTDYIKANPLTAVGIAFGIGYLGMRVFRR